MIHFGLPAYVGPGAGFAFLGSFLSLVSAVLAGIASVLLWPFRMAWLLVRRPAGIRRRKVIFLGFDGLDAAITERMMAEGKLPALSRLRDTGSYRRLRTTFPPLSAVAWSTFATGVNPGKHHVFDNPAGGFAARKSDSFWKILGRHAVESTILRVPGSWPERFNGRELTTRISTEVFSRFTSAQGELHAPDGSAIPFRFNGRTIEIQGESFRLSKEGDTPWIRLKLPRSTRRIVRFFLARSEPEIELYATPVQTDPESPDVAISYPRYYAKYLAKLLGIYSTESAECDASMSKDLSLRQARLSWEECETMFLEALAKTRHGVVACVFDAADRVQHMFHGQPDLVEPIYREADRITGETLARTDADTVLFVLSAHGFRDFRRAVNLNTWLLREGYLALKTGIENIDWSRTRAYARGRSGIYVNLRGRESKGIVPLDQAEALRTELAARLSGLRDEGTGEIAIQSAWKSSDLYHGPYLNSAPDILIGYAEQYGPSRDTVRGEVGPNVFEDSCDRQCGGHCVEPSLVPGVLFSNLKITMDSPGLEDMAPTALSLFGVEAPAWMEGRPVVSA